MASSSRSSVIVPFTSVRTRDAATLPLSVEKMVAAAAVAAAANKES